MRLSLHSTGADQTVPVHTDQGSHYYHNNGTCRLKVIVLILLNTPGALHCTKGRWGVIQSLNSSKSAYIKVPLINGVNVNGEKKSPLFPFCLYHTCHKL